VLSCSSVEKAISALEFSTIDIVVAEKAAGWNKAKAARIHRKCCFKEF
jgi:hypothetical protein